MPQVMLTMMLLACLLGCCAPSVSAQNQQILLASGIGDHNSHAWAVYRNSASEILLVHVPPRDAGSHGAIRTDAAVPGTLQAFRPLGHRFPLAIAAIDERIYLVFPKAHAQGRQIMRVYMGSAVPNPVGASWTFAPIDRLDSKPPIETRGDLLDLVATSTSLYALIKEDGQLQLLTMGDTQWTPVPLPPVVAHQHQALGPTRDHDNTQPPAEPSVAPSAQSTIGPRAHDWALASVGEQLLLIDRDADPLVPLALDKDTATWDSAQWAPMPRPEGDFSILSGQRGMTLLHFDAKGKATLSAWARSGVFTIASDLTLPADARYTVLDSVNELLGIEALPRSVKDAIDTPAVALWELDLSDGATVYQGPPVAQTPVSIGEFRFLAGMMVLVMVGVLVVVIMPDRPDAMQVPDGFALADPGRRLIATLVDVGLVALLMGEIFGVRASEILTLGVILRPDNAWFIIPSTMLCGVVTMTLFERFLGATPGKLLMGIRVVKALPGPMQRPGLWSALVRNIIKWILPPVAALALVDPETLHRGDRATRTLVVTPIRPVAPPDGDPDQH